MITFKILRTSYLYVPSCQNFSLPVSPPPSYPSFVFAPSHRKEQRHNSHVPATTGTGERGGSGREGAEGEAAGGHRRSQPCTHAQVGRLECVVVSRPATCGKKITFPVSLLAQEEMAAAARAGRRLVQPASLLSFLPLSSWLQIGRVTQVKSRFCQGV